MHGIDRGHAASGQRGADFGAIQICEQGIPSGQNKNKSEWNGNRRRRIRGDGRTLFVESEKQIMQAAEGVAKSGRECCAAARSSRGLPRTIFQGMEERRF